MYDATLIPFFWIMCSFLPSDLFCGRLPPILFVIEYSIISSARCSSSCSRPSIICAILLSLMRFLPFFGFNSIDRVVIFGILVLLCLMSHKHQSNATSMQPFIAYLHTWEKPQLSWQGKDHCFPVLELDKRATEKLIDSTKKKSTVYLWHVQISLCQSWGVLSTFMVSADCSAN